MPQFDDRIFSVVLSYGQTQVTLDGQLDITASGNKYADITQNECTITIDNLKKETRDQLATQLTPYNYDQARKSVQLFAGRKSTGLFLLFQGDITNCLSGQPPDIRTTIQSKTGQFYKLDLVAQSQNVSAPLSSIASSIGGSMGLSTRFEATDKQVGNYSYTGSTLKQVDKLADVGGVDAYIDDGTLVVKDRGAPLKNTTFVLSRESGLIGVPEPTEYGVRCKCLLDPTAQLGGGLTLQSQLNPFLNGDYTIYKVGFQIASRDTPFYTIIEASKYPILYGAANLPA